MALKVARSDLYPVGTTVRAFVSQQNRHHGGRPAGVAAESAVVAADGTLTFAGLASGLYQLWAEVAGRDVSLLSGSSQAFTVPRSLPARLLSARAAVGAPALF